MNRLTLRSLIFLSLLVPVSRVIPAEIRQPSCENAFASASSAEVILHSNETRTLLPDTLTYRGEGLLLEPRNSGGIRFSDGRYLLTAVVDTSGHATGAREGFQAYLKTEVPLDIHGHKVSPGTYGVSLDDRHRFVVTDLSGGPIFVVDS